jgi:hypothetical protein
MPIGASIWAPIAASAVGGYLANQSSSSTSPTLDPTYGPLQQQVLAMIMKRLNTGTDLSGYTATGVGNIGRTFDLLKQSQSNDLTARGLGTSPVAGAVDATRENARGGEVSRFQNSIPLIQRDFQNQDLGLASNLLGFGRGATSTSTTGGGQAGAATNLAAMLGYMSQKGLFRRTPAQGTGPGDSSLPMDQWGQQTWGFNAPSG